MQCRRCSIPMRLTTKRGDVRYLECDSCGRRARKEPSREPIWSEPSESFIASHNDHRRVQVPTPLAAFTVARGSR